MDVAGPNQTQLVGRHVHPLQSCRTSTHYRSSQKMKENYSASSAWTTTYQAPEASVVSPCAGALSSFRLPNVVHTSTPPATCLRMSLVICIYSQPVPIHVPPLDLDAGNQD
jgi:hypothetical protein